MRLIWVILWFIGLVSLLLYMNNIKPAPRNYVIKMPHGSVLNDGCTAEDGPNDFDPMKFYAPKYGRIPACY